MMCHALIDHIIYETTFLTKNRRFLSFKDSTRNHGEWFVILFIFDERIAICVLRLKVWCLYDHFLQSYTLIFNRCAYKNFILKRLLQYKTKHIIVILQLIFHQE